MTRGQQAAAAAMIVAGHISPAISSEPASYAAWIAWVRYCMERAEATA